MEVDFKTLGIIGAGRGTGVTHLTIWMANYLVGVRQRRVAVLEWNRRKAFTTLEHFCTGKEGVQKPYEIQGVDYWKEAGAKELAACMNKNYHHIIIDFGDVTESTLYECVRCDRKIILGGLSEWQVEAFLRLLRAEKKLDKGWNYAAVFGSEQTRREIEKTFHLKLLRVPLSVDAFTITRAHMDFFRILERGRTDR